MIASRRSATIRASSGAPKIKPTNRATAAFSTAPSLPTPRTGNHPVCDLPVAGRAFVPDAYDAPQVSRFGGTP